MDTATNKRFIDNIKEAPVPTEGEPGGAHLEALRERAAKEGGKLAAVLEQEPVVRLLTGVFDGSPFLAQLATRDSRRLERILSSDPDQLAKAFADELVGAMADAQTLAEAKKVLRLFKSNIALLTALADCAGVWPVMRVTRVLTEAADVSLQQAVRFLFRLAHDNGQWNPPDAENPEVGSGYIVLAMGKQGGYELNYSSDIDLIIFYDRACSRLSGDKDLQTFMVRLTRDLVQLMEERTADGYVFRTDLRLRPDAGATQMALSTAAAFGYYETVGQNWERAAFIKARPCAGDIDAGMTFLAELMPFVWRKYLDYHQIADVHAMKRQINVHRGFGAISIPGHNIKLGRGGIREIEFFAQTQQLIAGGRQPHLRVRSTLEALLALEQSGWVAHDVRCELTSAYLLLRRVEHRLQMIADEQTHELPKDDADLERLAHYCGYGNKDEMASELIGILRTVEKHFAELFEGSPDLSPKGANLVFAGANDDPGTVSELERLGYSRPSDVLAIVRGWHHGRRRAVSTAKARELLTEVQPALIAALADTIDPDTAIAEFDRFLTQLPGGVQLFSLLKANPKLLRLIADIMGSTPRLAKILSQRRRLLDAVLDPRVLVEDITPEALNGVIDRAFSDVAQHDGCEDMQDILDTARVVGSEQKFLIGIGLLTGQITAAEAGAAYATVAECLVARLLTAMVRQIEHEHGKIEGGEAVVVAMGKLGGREISASSDLDLILIYDFAPDAKESDGRRPLSPAQYYTRLTQRLIAAISSPTAQGVLYDVDLRLRPSGQQGPLATRFSSFVHYQNEEAWTWEHMALTRARVIAGDPVLQARVESAIKDVLCQPRDKSKIASDVDDMRERIAREKGSDQLWDLKVTRGGLIDLEFIVQYLQLISADGHPEALDPGTLVAIDKLRQAGVLDEEAHGQLAGAGHLLHDLTQILRLSLDGPFDPSAAPEGLKALLARAGQADTFEALNDKLKASTDGVAAVYDRILR